ncbi:cupin [Neiella marina]|uniref:Cupin n=1 Tax=Neiella marina TaxID=508461 RepID=A0A8J2XNJ0_9GAMM|nr:cupin-like domain-containing protein [Neiella marina]GGA73649.1 cupin [Neiella marina]
MGVDVKTQNMLRDIAETALEPVVLRGAIADWPIVKKANQSSEQLSQYLSQYAGNEALLAYFMEPQWQGRIGYQADFQGFNFESLKITVDQLFEQLARCAEADQKPTLYMGSTNVDRWFPGLSDDNPLDFTSLPVLTNIWIGNQSIVSAHFDWPDNFACLVAGKRTFTLFPPEQLENLYIGPLDYTPAGPAISLVDFDAPDFTKFPKFKTALEHAQVFELNPGDVLFVPSMWWHHVKSHDDVNVLMNYWWKKSKAYLPTPMDSLNLSIMSLRSLSKEQKRMWLKMIEYYVMNDDFSHIPESSQGLLSDLSIDDARKYRSMILNALNR